MARKLARKDGRDTSTDGSTDQNTVNDSSDRLLGRREYVKLGMAATAVIAAGAGTGAAAREMHGIEFESVIDAVDDLGMDPSGSQPIDPHIEDIPDDTLVEFPDGEYLFTGQTVLARKGAIGFYATGDATLKTAPNTNTYHLNIVDTDAILLAGFTLDQTGDNCCYAYRLHAREQLYVGDIDVVGRGIRENADGTVAMNLSLTEPDGFGLVEGWIDREGSTWAAYNSGLGRIGSFSGTNHEGTLRFVGCDLREFGNNALYSSRTASTGNIQVEESYFENNNAGSIRISGEGSYVDNCTIVLSEERYTGPRDADHESTSFAHRPIVIEQRTDDEERRKEAGVEIRDTEIYIEPSPAAYPPIHAYPNSRSILVDGCHIEVTGPIKGSSPCAQKGLVQRAEYRDSLAGNYPPGEPPRWLRMSNTTIVGEPGDIETAVYVADGDGAVIENCWIELETDGNGITIADSEDCLIEDTNIVVGGNAEVFDESEVTTRNITNDTSDDEEEAETLDEEEEETENLDDEEDTDNLDEEETDNLNEEEDTDNSDDEWQSLVVGGLDHETMQEYEFLIDGEARENHELSDYGTVSTIESVSDGLTRVAGAVRSGRDAFDYDGCIVDFSAGHDMIFVRDGDQIDRSEIIECEVADHDPTNGVWQSLQIDGLNHDTMHSYEFIIAGEAQENNSLSSYGTVSTIESIDDGLTRVAGAVRSGRDAFNYDGCIVEFTAGEDMTFARDGEPIDRADVIDCDHVYESTEPLLDHELHIVGTGTTSSFEFTVADELIADPECADPCEETISGTSAEGAVTDLTASYRFSGDITAFSVEGEAGVYLDGKQVDPTLLDTDEDPALTQWLTVDGDSTETTYEFSVTGNVYKSPDLGPVEADDTISDGTVVGSVTDEIDGYRFTGYPTELYIDGSAKLQLGSIP